MDPSIIPIKADVTKPLNRLTEAFVRFLGPRLAQADQKAALIDAETKIKIDQMNRDAGYIPEEQRTRDDRNQAAILEGALNQSEDVPDPQAVDDDWTAHFLDKARLVSDKEMQSLWSRILAGEMNSPGSFSKRTMSFVSDLSKGEADQFTRLCGFCFDSGGPLLLVFDYEDEIYKSNQVDFTLLGHLEAIGLINFDFTGGTFTRRIPEPFAGDHMILKLQYYGEPLPLRVPRTDNLIITGMGELTQIGKELFPICGSGPVPGFREYVMEQWKKFLPGSGI